MEKFDLTKFNETIEKLIRLNFRFSVIHNPTAKQLQIISATEPDRLKHKFPDFNIYLSGNTKMVECFFFYSE